MINSCKNMTPSPMCPAKRAASRKHVSHNHIISQVDLQRSKQLVEKAKWKRAKRDQMSHKDFIEWCKTNVRKCKMDWIAEAKSESENDSWIQVSNKASIRSSQKI